MRRMSGLAIVLTLSNSSSLMEMYKLPLEQRTCKGRGQDVEGSVPDKRAYVSTPKRNKMKRNTKMAGLLEWYDTSAK